MGGERRPSSTTAFETTNLGLLIQHEVIGNDQSEGLEVRFVILDRNHLGEVERPKSISDAPPSPLFESRRCSGTIPVVQDVPLLVGTLSPSGETGVNGRKDSGMVWVVFAKALPAQQ